MPSGLVTSLLVFGAILTTVSALAGVIVAGVGVLIEFISFLLAGLPRVPQLPDGL